MDNATPEKLGASIEALRISRGLTQTEFAVKTGLSRNRINTIENGKAKDIKLSTIVTLFGALGYRIDITVSK